MNSISDRISYLIEHLGLSKSKVAEQLHVSGAFISYLCNGTKLPSDRTISDICRLFNVSEAWLRDGIGEMFVDSEFRETPQQFLARLVMELSRLSSEELSAIQKLSYRLHNPGGDNHEHNR